MRMTTSKALALVLAVLWAAAASEPAVARDRGADGFSIMVEEGGKPAKKNKGAKKGEPKARPRGSSYIPSLTLPRSQPVVVAPASPGVYRPPPINSFSDRVTNCIHSFPLNAGIGNNPTERSAYVRQCAN
jgi:hypothetical protein